MAENASGKKAAKKQRTGKKVSAEGTAKKSTSRRATPKKATIRKTTTKQSTVKKSGSGKVASKKTATVAKAKPAASAKKAGPRVISAEQRAGMIAEAAFYRAENRGFAGGDPRADWISAEAEIDAALERDNISISG